MYIKMAKTVELIKLTNKIAVRMMLMRMIKK